MKKLLTTLLVLCIVTAQITATGAVGMLYGTLDTLDTALTTVENLIPGGLFHSETSNGDVSSGFGLGQSDINPDGELRDVWYDLSYYFRVYSIAGLDEIDVYAVKPYVVSAEVSSHYVPDGSDYDRQYECMQVSIHARIYGFLPYSATFLFPYDDTEIFFVSATGNTYQVIDKTKGEFLTAVQLSGIGSNNYICVEPNPESRVSLKEWWEQTIYD